MHKMEGNVIVMLDVQKDGSIVERIPGVGQDATTANTLLGAMYPDAKIAIVSVPTELLEDHEESAVARTLTSVRHNGVHYKMVGASGSAKNGKYYFCDAAHEPALAKRFAMWPEAAITYFGILVSNLKVVHQEADKTVCSSSKTSSWVPTTAADGSEKACSRNCSNLTDTSTSSVWRSGIPRQKVASR